MSTAKRELVKTTTAVVAEPSALLDEMIEATRMDAVAVEAAKLVEQFKTGHFQRAVVLARARRMLLAAARPLLPDMLALMNSPLGFMTDHNPRVTDYKTQRPMVPYADDVVLECVVDATLQGLYPVGNEWNIIGERVYITKNGMARLVREYPGLTDLRLSPDVPRVRREPNGSGAAIVKYRATWKVGGTEQSIERDIPIKVNRGMGEDAILGKAERKILAAIYTRLTGSVISDGDVEDMPESVRRPARPDPKPEVFDERKDEAPAGASAGDKPGPATDDQIAEIETYLDSLDLDADVVRADLDELKAGSIADLNAGQAAYYLSVLRGRESEQNGDGGDE